jgi:hypothetical protein
MIASATTQPRPKPVHWFVAHAIALSLLIGFWPTPRAAYPALFHAHASALFGSVERPHVRIGLPGPQARASGDTTLAVRARAGTAEGLESSFSITRIGYWPSAMLLAMLLSTPLPPLRRALTAAAGLLLVDLFTLARIGIEIAHLTHQLPGGSRDSAPGPLAVLLHIGSESLTATIPSVAFVLVCWVALARPWRTIDLSPARAAIGARPR